MLSCNLGAIYLEFGVLKLDLMTGCVSFSFEQRVYNFTGIYKFDASSFLNYLFD
jgi:hypothetical protein